MAIGLGFLLIFARPAFGQACSQPLNPQFYEDKGYLIRRIEFRNPFNFIFLVRHRMRQIKEQLPIAEGQGFSKTRYEASAATVEEVIKSDDSFGNSLAKIVVVTASLESCQEKDDAAKTVDVVYRIFSTDPVPVVRALPEKRQSAVNEPATTVAEDSTKAFYKLRPMLGYEPTRRGYAGVDFLLRIPGQIFDDLHLTVSGSASSRLLEFQMDGVKAPKLRALDQAEYHLAYHYASLPAAHLRLAKGSFQARFTGLSKPLETPSARFLLRYGAAVELGNQHGERTTVPLPSDIVLNSAYGAVRAYTGLTRTSRYSETAISYGLQIGGTELGNLSFAKQVGDVAYSRRFPGGTHAPWDVQMRFSAGGITGTNGLLLNERFFGGNTVSNFIPNDAWSIPNGPIVRSIARQNLNGAGFGGTAFYSTNLTIGKVIVGRPLIPREIEEAQGFGSGIEAAENTAERFFADDYLAASPEFKHLALEHGGKLKTDLDAVQATLKSIRDIETVTPGSALEKALKEAERQARLAQNIIRHASEPDERGRIDTFGLVALLNPTTSRLLQLLAVFPKLQPLIRPHLNEQLQASEASIKQHLSGLRTTLDTLRTGPVGQAAAAQAQHDMLRPREIIDTLRHEANRFSFSLVGIFDAGRIWPDSHGTRYAIGGGGRFSLLNVNFTAGYAVNPAPQRALGQGRGAVVFSLTYTELFR